MPRRHRSKPKKRAPKTTVAKLAKKVESLIKQDEVKYQDINYGSTVSSIGTFELLNGITQGDGAGNREGLSITMKSVQVSGNFVVQDAYNELRAMLVLDTESHGSTPTLADLLEYTGSPVNSMISRVNRQRFVVLAQKIVTVDTNRPNVRFNLFRKLNHNVEYNATGNTAVSIQKGTLWLVMVSDSSVSSHPAIAVYSRLRYVG